MKTCSLAPWVNPGTQNVVFLDQPKPKILWTSLLAGWVWTPASRRHYVAPEISAQLSRLAVGVLCWSVKVLSCLCAALMEVQGPRGVCMLIWIVCNSFLLIPHPSNLSCMAASNTDLCFFHWMGIPLFAFRVKAGWMRFGDHLLCVPSPKDRNPAQSQQTIILYVVSNFYGCLWQ